MSKSKQNSLTLDKVNRFVTLMESEPFWKDYFQDVAFCYSSNRSRVASVRGKLMETLAFFLERELGICSHKEKEFRKLSIKEDFSVTTCRFDAGHWGMGELSSGTFTGPMDGVDEINHSGLFLWDCTDFCLSFFLYQVICETEIGLFEKMFQNKAEDLPFLIMEQADRDGSDYALGLLTFMECNTDDDENLGEYCREILLGAMYFVYLSGNPVSEETVCLIRKECRLWYYNLFLYRILSMDFLQTGYLHKGADSENAILDDAREFWPLIQVACEVFFGESYSSQGTPPSCFCFSSEAIYRYKTGARDGIPDDVKTVMDRLLCILEEPLRMRTCDGISDESTASFFHMESVLSHKTGTACYAYLHFRDSYACIPEAKFACGLFHMLFQQNVKN